MLVVEFIAMWLGMVAKTHELYPIDAALASLGACLHTAGNSSGLAPRSNKPSHSSYSGMDLPALLKIAFIYTKRAATSARSAALELIAVHVPASGDDGPVRYSVE